MVDGLEEWIGTKVSFDLKQDGDFTIVLFKHPRQTMSRSATGTKALPMKVLSLRGRVQRDATDDRRSSFAADVDKVFKALADPTRRHLLDLLHRENGQTLTALCEHRHMTRQAVTQHLQQLQDANLVAIVWQGREKLHYLNPVPLHEIHDRWIEKFEHNRVNALRDLKKRLEGDDDDKT